ncbi:hypothetical protein Tco_1052923, partial [Tanacetum coccineum]
QSSSVAHIQSVTTHHLNTDPDAEQYQSFAKPKNLPFNFATQRHKRSRTHLMTQASIIAVASNITQDDTPKRMNSVDEQGSGTGGTGPGTDESEN